MPCADAVTPTTARISSSAAPGLPPGNVENSLCSVPLPTVPVYVLPKIILGLFGAIHNISVYFYATFVVFVPARIRLLKLDDSAPNTDRHGLRPVTCAQLLHDVFDVNLDRLFGNKELLGNVAVSVSARDLA